ncbi:MAG: hypothetical protein ACFB21_00715 [Opitutales bacterium]
MNFAGALILLLSVGGVSVFFGWCMYRVLTTPDETEHLHSTYDHTPDEKT